MSRYFVHSVLVLSSCYYVLSEITVQFDPVTYTVTEGVGVVANMTIMSNRAIQGPTVLRVFYNAAGSAMGECDPCLVTFYLKPQIS